MMMQLLKELLLQDSENKIMKVILIVGDSGVGKSTLAQYLKENYNFNIVKSYTTRSKRNFDDNDHMFISQETADEMLCGDDIVAHTRINDCDYFSSVFDFRLDKTNVYIVDKKGVDDIRRNCPDWEVKVLKMKTNENNIIGERSNRTVNVPEDKDCDLILERKVIHKYDLYRKNVLVPKTNWVDVL